LKARDESIDIDALNDITKLAPDINVPYDRIAELKLLEAERIANKPTPISAINAAASQAASEPWKRNKNDHGSPEVQVVVANERIKYLTKHCLDNKFDYASKRGLQALVNHRRKMLNYLYNNGSKEKALELAKSLSIRFTPPGQMHVREIKYKSFKNTKQGRKDKGMPKPRKPSSAGSILP
jgi:small subunit ribosomal protein S15